MYYTLSTVTFTIFPVNNVVLPVWKLYFYVNSKTPQVDINLLPMLSSNITVEIDSP